LNNMNLTSELSSDVGQDNNSDLLLIEKRIVENRQKNSVNEPFQGFLEKILERVERLAVILWHDKFDEVEAAMYLRLPDPFGKGAETVRYHALRTHKLSFHKVGRNGLIFTKADLDKSLKLFRFESHRDL